MLPGLLPEKGKSNSRGVKMKMLVTKLSNGKYRNEGELFSEPISKENVKLMGEMIALQALRTVKNTISESQINCISASSKTCTTWAR